MPSKLPAYFEELINTRFAETNKKIDELKLHVNDENGKMCDRIGVLERQVVRIWVAFLVLTPLYVKESRDAILGLVFKLFGL